MNHSTIMKCAAVLAAIAGLACLFAPNQMLSLYGAPALNGPGLYNTMLYGALLIGFAVMNWRASQGTSAAAAQVILGAFVAYALALLVSLIQQLTTPMPAAGWINVAIFAVFTVLFGYLQFGPQAGDKAVPAAG
jgi:hypothetical protein